MASVRSAWGAIRSESGTGAVGNEWRFTGEQRDPQASRQFYYLRARYYDPATGRFLSQDPVPAGNLYAYTGNNPVNWVDPSGQCVPEITCPLNPKDTGDKEGGNWGGGVFFGVDRGNLKPCKGGRNFNHAVKDYWGAGPRDDVLCDKNGNVYIQRWYYDKSGQRKPGALEEAGHKTDYQAALSGGGHPFVDVVTPDRIIAGTAIGVAIGAGAIGYYMYYAPGTGAIPLRLGPPIQ